MSLTDNSYNSRPMTKEQLAERLAMWKRHCSNVGDPDRLIDEQNACNEMKKTSNVWH